MKKFILRFLLWLVIPFLLAILVDWMVSSGLRKTDLRKYAVWNDIYKGGMHPDLLVVGNSQAWNGYDPRLMDSILNIDSYNLSIVGHFVDYQIIQYNTYRRFNAKPKVVALNVSFIGTLGITADKQYEREQFFPYIWDDSLISLVKDDKEITFFDRYLPLCRYFGYRDEMEEGVKAFFGKKEFPDGHIFKGYRGDASHFNRGEILPKNEMLTNIYDAAAIEMFDSFVRKIRNEGIAVVFVKYPVYYPLRAKFTNIAESDSIFEAVSRRYDVPILDFSCSALSKDSTNYFNPSHLGKKGAEIFTKEFCQCLDSLGVLKDEGMEE